LAGSPIISVVDSRLRGYLGLGHRSNSYVRSRCGRKLHTGNLSRYWNYMLQKMDADQSRGITALLQGMDDIGYRLRWTPLDMMRSGTRRERRLGRLLAGRPPMLRRIDGLSHREYEALGCVVCKMAGASRTHLTPPGNEGGIDFLALVTLPAQCRLFGPRRGPLRIIGQSKRYKGPVSVGDVRNFITTIENVRKRQPSVEPHVPARFRAAPRIYVWLSWLPEWSRKHCSRSRHHYS
jgi:hypothetical protein